MSEEKEDDGIFILRMEKLLGGVTSEIQAIEKRSDEQNSPLLKEIIDLIELLKKCVVSQMKTTPKEERMHVIDILDYQTRVAETLSEIEDLQRIRKDQDSTSQIYLRDIVTCIDNEENVMETIREISNGQIPREIETSTREIWTIKQREELQERQLQSAIDAAERRLQRVMKRNAANETKLRKMCARVEREYMDLLVKYDRDIGASYALREKLLNDYKVIRAETRNIEEQLTVQRQLYVRFKKEREIALMKAFTEKLEFFRRNRAAKIIQRTWRMYLERISLKKRRRTRRK